MAKAKKKATKKAAPKKATTTKKAAPKKAKAKRGFHEAFDFEH